MDNELELSGRGGPVVRGGAFAPDLPKTGLTGALSICGANVRFEASSQVLEIPLKGAVLTPGGANGGILFFTHPAFPGLSLHTADREILQDAAIVGDPELTRQVVKAQKKSRQATSFFWLLGLLFAAGILGVVLSKNWLVRKAAERVPVSLETKVGDAFFQSMAAGGRFIESDSLAAELRKITQPLESGLGPQRFIFKYHIVDDESLNAYAVPGGQVVLHTGLLLAADSAEEVAGVLAHEIAHVAHRHSTQNLISTAGLGLLVQSLLGDLSGLAAVMVDNGQFLMDRKFSRDFERDADMTGWEYLLAANMDPRGMIEFFKKIQAEGRNTPAGRQIEKAMSVVGTHPATEERIQSLEEKSKLLDKKTRFRSLDLDYPEFKKKVRQAVSARKR